MIVTVAAVFLLVVAVVLAGGFTASRLAARADRQRAQRGAEDPEELCARTYRERIGTPITVRDSRGRELPK